jgi:hypothetical protein
MGRGRDPEWDAKVERAIETNTCFHCSEPILPGQARYTVNHSHWDCHERQMAPIRDALASAEAARAERERVPLYKPKGGSPTYDGLWIVRAAGGSKIHLLPDGKERALCGHQPKRTAHRMRQRGGWYVSDPESRAMFRMQDGQLQRFIPYCDKCQTARADHKPTGATDAPETSDEHE